MEPEGIESPRPGKSSERPWSKGREPYIRNVEAEGSNPFTSTKGPVQRPKVGSSEGHEALLSATAGVVALAHSVRRFHQRPCSQADSRMFGTVGGAVGCGVSLCVFIDEVLCSRHR